MQDGAPTPKKSAISFIDGSTIVAKPGADIPGGSVLSQIAAEGNDRLFRDDYDIFEGGTGSGWDTSTEPKNQADMMALAMKQNPVVGFWGECINVEIACNAACHATFVVLSRRAQIR